MVKAYKQLKEECEGVEKQEIMEMLKGINEKGKCDGVMEGGVVENGR